MAALTIAESVCLLAPIAPLPLLFLRAGHSRNFWLAWSAVVSVAALWALLVGLSDALSVGTVSLPANRGGQPRPVVPWFAAWAYFSGLLLSMTAALLLSFSALQPRREGLRLIAALLAMAGWLMLAFSREFSSLQRATDLLAFAGVLGLVLWVGHRFGKRTALAAWIAVVACVVWLSSGA